MRSFPSPPIVSSTLSGFVIGVLVTLLASGVIGRSSGSGTPVTKPSTPVPVKSVRDKLLETQLRRIASRVLGPDPTGQKSRFLGIQIANVSTLDLGLVPPGVEKHYRSVMLTFRLNDHPLGPTWRLREAKADVFALLKAIYISQLPVYNTELIGRFQTKGKKSTLTYDAIVAYITYQTAAKIPWKRWGRTHEAQVWTMLDYQSVDKRFA